MILINVSSQKLCAFILFEVLFNYRFDAYKRVNMSLILFNFIYISLRRLVYICKFSNNMAVKTT